MDSTFARVLMGLVAGGLTVLLIDRFIWPGTLFAGFIGVVAAVSSLTFAKPKP